MSEKSLSSLRGIVKAVNVLAMRKQKIYIEHPNMWRPDTELREMFYGSLTLAGFSLTKTLRTMIIFYTFANFFIGLIEGSGAYLWHSVR